MPMARAAGVTGVWARYGSYVEEEHRHIISEVSCWAADKVHQELAVVKPVREEPGEFTIASFSELRDVLAGCHRTERPKSS
jgi:hypothetical protein